MTSLPINVSLFQRFFSEALQQMLQVTNISISGKESSLFSVQCNAQHWTEHKITLHPRVRSSICGQDYDLNFGLIFTKCETQLPVTS